jgi:hypothetical protein
MQKFREDIASSSFFLGEYLLSRELVRAVVG